MKFNLEDLAKLIRIINETKDKLPYGLKVVFFTISFTMIAKPPMVFQAFLYLIVAYATLETIKSLRQNSASNKYDLLRLSTAEYFYFATIFTILFGTTIVFKTFFPSN